MSYRHHTRQSEFVGPKDEMEPQARSPWATGSLDMGPQVSHRVQPAQQAFFHGGHSGNIRAPSLPSAREAGRGQCQPSCSALTVSQQSWGTGFPGDTNIV